MIAVSGNQCEDSLLGTVTGKQSAEAIPLTYRPPSPGPGLLVYLSTPNLFILPQFSTHYRFVKDWTNTTTDASEFRSNIHTDITIATMTAG